MVVVLVYRDAVSGIWCCRVFLCGSGDGVGVMVLMLL